MSFFWEMSTESGIFAGLSFGLTLENYWLYTRDILQSRGATYGVRALPTGSEGGLHPDHFRTGRDDKNDWVQIAAFTKPGDSSTIVNIWVQNWPGLEDENNRGILFGKQFAIPLNSGPGYLSTRSDDDFILSSPLENSNVYGAGGGGNCWGICRADMYNLHGYTENDFVQPAQGPKEPFSDAQNQLGDSYIWSDTGCFLRNATLLRNNTTNATTGNVVSFPSSGGFLQSGLSSHDTRSSALDSCVYTGGEFTAYARTRQDAGTDPPDTAELGVTMSLSIMSLQAATQIDFQTDGTHDYRIYYVSGTLDFPVGYHLRNRGIVINASDGFYWGDPAANGTVQKAVAYFDPWVSLARAPKYTITTTNNKCIKGGIPPAWP